MNSVSSRVQINFVVGDAEATEEGALRASLGFPEPFSLKWVEVGNEVWKCIFIQ
jgi:alpha-L-arabinofuranosidase